MTIRLLERKGVPHSSLVKPILVLRKAKSLAEKENDSYIPQNIEEDEEVLVLPTRSDTKNIKAARQVLLKVMCQMSVLLFIKAAGLIEITSYEDVPKFIIQIYHRSLCSPSFLHPYLQPQQVGCTPPKI